MWLAWSPAFGKRFSLRSAGPSSDAAAVARKLGARKSADGWHDIHLTAPNGDQVRVFVDGDRSVASRRLAWHAARLARALDPVHPGHGVNVSKSTGVASREWIDLVALEFDRTSRSVTAVWHDGELRAAGFDPTALRTSYTEAVSRSSAARPAADAPAQCG